LLLASVAKLKWGYDCARDSVLFDLADRFSKLDATQIDGRVFRLDPEDDDKTATVFNLQDENSEEHYERHPELSPIHCAEVIEGAEFREPAKRRKAHIRFKEPPPEMEQTLQEAGFDVIHDINIVRTISGANQERRNKAKKKLPTKEAEWLSSAEMTKFYAGHYSIYRPMLEKHAETLRQNFVRQGKSPEEAADLVDKQFIGWRTNTGNSVICASPEAIAQLERQGTLRLRNKSKEADWLSNVEMKEYYIGSEKGFKSLLENRAKNLCQEFIQQGMSPEDAADLVDRNFIGLRLNGPNTAICASPEALMQLKQQGKLRLKIERPPAKEPGWLTGREMAEVYIGTSTSFNSLLERYSKIFCQEFIEQGNSPENAANLVEKQFAGLRTTGGQAVQCVSPEAIAQLVQRGELRLRSAQHGFKEQGWLSDSEMKKYYVGRREGFKLLLEKQAESLRQELIWQGQSPEESAAYVDKHFVGLRQIGGRSVLCASPAVLAQLEQQGKLRRRELIQAARPKKIKKPSSKSSPSGAGE
jgi:hypothetical protein